LFDAPSACVIINRITVFINDISKAGIIMYTENHIGSAVKKIRKMRGFTQDHLARRADVTFTTLTKLESNVVKKPSVQTIAKIARALNVSIESLLN